jgi:outer membrane protein assembly factor BamB
MSSLSIGARAHSRRVPAGHLVLCALAALWVSACGGGGGGTPNNSLVQVNSLSPNSAVASGPGFGLTVNGAKFSPQSTVLWDGLAQTTAYMSPTQLTAMIGASAISAAGSRLVTVNDPVNGTSNPVSFSIQPATFGLISVSPASVTAGGPAFTLTVLGTGFSNTSTVWWNGSFRPTTFGAFYELLAQISAADIATTGSASITVHDPTNPVGTTAPATLTIAPASIDAVAFQINPAHNGAVNFASVSFPALPKWSVDVGGSPSYALITHGKVYVTVAVPLTGNSQLVALDQATGATVWGPIAISGAANAAYDSGKVFVVGAPPSSGFNLNTIQAFDAVSGQLLWSITTTNPDGGNESGVTAADGLVVTAAFALDQNTGAPVWQGINNPQSAVTADGVYFAFDCPYVVRPATGELIWTSIGLTSCFPADGPPVVANQLLYTPSGDNQIFNAETGASVGTHAADYPGAFTASTGYFPQGGTLQGVRLSDNTVQWSFAGDGLLVTSPIAVNQYVIIGSSSGNLYALDGTTGQQVWQAALGAVIPPGASWDAQVPLSGLAAGDGLLVVPNGTRVTAYTLSTNP